VKTFVLSLWLSRKERPVFWWPGGLVLTFPLSLSFLCAPHSVCADGQVRFSSVASEAGITFRHVDGRSGRKYFVETIGSGCAFVDFDNDGDIDIYLVNAADLPGFQSASPPRNALYRNNGDGTFTFVTEKAGVGHTGYGAGVSAGDYNNDGFVDLYVTNFGPNVLYRNNGDGTFADVTAEAGVGDARWSAGSAFADYDNDGFLDLYVANYCEFTLEKHKTCHEQGVEVYCGPEEFSGVPDTLYRNNGDGTFTDVTRPAGVYDPDGKGMGVIWADYDNDDDLDIFVANDGTENCLYRNNGDGTFTDVAWMAGVESDERGNPQGSMGVDFGDYNNDGLLDLVVTNFQRQLNMVYRNDDEGFFSDVSFIAGMGYSLPDVSWGTGFFDFDNDGLRDLFIANGHIQDEIERYDKSATYLQLNQLHINLGDGRFAKVTADAGPGLQIRKASRGAAFGDYDNDGDIDILVSNAHDAPDLLRNETANDNHWATIKTVGVKSNRDGVGAKIIVQTGDLTQLAFVRSGASYMSQNDMRVHFGLGKATQIDRLEIRWPSGVIDRMLNAPVDQVISVTEGECGFQTP
jgi:hypothetical protein